MIKSLLVRILSTQPFIVAGGRLYSSFVPIFMLHRFSWPEIGSEGHSAEDLTFALEFLRKQKFNFVSIDEIACAIASQTPLPENSIAFSLDDGYADQVEVAGKIFAKFDCPATYFVTTGFIDKSLWFWDSKIHYLLESCDDKQLARLASQYLQGVDRPTRYAVAEKIVFSLTQLPLKKIEEQIATLAQNVELVVPEVAPQKYRATDWHRLREFESLGMVVGAHTVSHPVLSSESDEVAMYEISESINRVRAETANPSNVFCYPVGRRSDFSKREEGLVQQLGFSGAVSAIPGVQDCRDRGSLYSLYRYGFPDQRADFIQYATWIESFKNALRNWKR